MLKNLIIIFFLSVLLVPCVALAEASTKSKVPELNPLCWKKAECETARGQMMPKDKVSAGWIQNISGSPCNKKDWGQCMAGSEVTTSIAIAGKTKFSDLGDYLITIYKYAIGLVSIFAVIMIIAGGAQWLTSAGSSEAITNAKKRIFGAIIGLAITYLSYVILYTINPALVSLRLPRTWLIKEQQAMPTFCRSLPTSTMAGKSFSKGADFKDQASKLTSPTGKYDLKYKDYFGPPLSKVDAKKRETFYCGKRFFVEDGGGATCKGDYCPKTDKGMSVCGAFGAQESQKYVCKDGTVAGEIYYTNPLPLTFGDMVWDGKWETDEIIDEDEQELWIVCSDRKVKEISSDADTISSEGHQDFFIIAEPDDIKEAIEDCGGETKTYGFAIKLEMNRQWSDSDADAFIGANGKYLGWGLDGNRNVAGSFFANVTEMYSGINAADLISVKDIISGVTFSSPINADNIPQL